MRQNYKNEATVRSHRAAGIGRRANHGRCARHGLHLPRPAHGGGNPTNRIYDLRFTVCDAMSNGLFPVTLDCGPGVFTGENRRLNIAVRTNGTLLTTFTNPTPLVSDYFGCSVAAVETGRVLIGACGNNTRAIDAGLV